MNKICQQSMKKLPTTNIVTNIVAIYYNSVYNFICNLCLLMNLNIYFYNSSQFQVEAKGLSIHVYTGEERGACKKWACGKR